MIRRHQISRAVSILFAGGLAAGSLLGQCNPAECTCTVVNTLSFSLCSKNGVSSCTAPTGYPAPYTNADGTTISYNGDDPDLGARGMGWCITQNGAARSDGSVVAVVTPASIGQVEGGSFVETQYGCVAADFELASGTFSDVVMTLTDVDTQPSGDPSENFGANGCTYDPVSNTGVLIVRKLVNGSSYFTGSLTATGVMP